MKTVEAVSQCLQCGSALDLAHVVPPRFGLVTIACSECGHQHLLSPLEIEVTRQEAAMDNTARQGKIGWLLRRFIVS